MKSQSGITILEAIIMIVILGVIGAITYPQFRTMLYQSREGRTKTSLGDIRGAIAIYYSDNFGLYPSDTGKPDTRLSSALVPTYLEEMPSVEIQHHHSKKMNTVHDRVDDGGDWAYSTLNGFVRVNCTHQDTEGEPISGW